MKDVAHLVELMISTFNATQNGMNKIEDSLRILAKENERLNERVEKAVNLGFEEETMKTGKLLKPDTQK